ncbi:hypothetical protein AX15_003333 [Amanita polypyramis BW_CC]|nr:hypothetical protein AX15_003333 [Amanita polypyramis BW_CC]
MVQLKVATSIALVQIALLTQTAIGLPVEDILKSRSLPNAGGNGDNHYRHHHKDDIPDNQAVYKRDHMGSPRYLTKHYDGISKRDYAELSRRMGTMTAVAGGAALAAFVHHELKKHSFDNGGGGGSDSGGDGGSEGLSKRNWDDLDKRHWDDIEERGWDDDGLEARDFDYDELDELD